MQKNTVLINKAETPAGVCPFAHGAMAPATTDPHGCPVSSGAEAFDPFDSAYQADPAEVLRWSRDDEPVFFSPKLGYWVVTRYDDVKAVFRDNTVFSPANALEKITPSSSEAESILKKYNYGMARTLVNEDEPAHLERRRALMFSFAPEELLHHEPMVRRLTREYVNRFVNEGKADLVNEMLWEIPLTVALHFLGVPEEDMGTLREYSIAHTVNTWGRPTPEQQLKVADSVGKFWNYAGKVLEKMRDDPSGHGWMKYAIRRQKELPEVITDSYLHSMMMAGIVAAHETTAHATANALRLLLENRSTWDRICQDASLIPQAVEECLRHSGSIVAWRRVALEDTEVGGVKIPKGGKLLIANASANHDERYFEDPDSIDIFRDNASEHLSFGYGSHQCLGKNLARMEMCIFLEELTKRLPHMRLSDNQDFKYLPNIAFRGPENLFVEWDVSLNPEKTAPEILETSQAIKIGAPSKEAVFREVVIDQIRHEADNVIGITLKNQDGSDFPKWSPGAHIDLMVGEFTRKYSLCGYNDTPNTLDVAVLREENGRGGSRYIHDTLKQGDTLKIKGPKNNFRLDEKAERYILIAGGIGITPILTMADRLAGLGKDYCIHYAGSTRSSMAFLNRLEQDHAGRCELYPKSEDRRADLKTLVSAADATTRIYVCGPDRMIETLEELCEHLPEDVLHFEHFAAKTESYDTSQDKAFELVLANSGMVVTVEPGQTALNALKAAGVEVESDCEEGLCGNCEVEVLEGEIDHRDNVLARSEKSENKRMVTCCSRAKTHSVKVAL
ncbi:cytochrome P450/oxidoreductase [Marinobacterium maritimum]|uniref:Cytochrome P450/oxidoreductase n=1 Tax=Marinobacterium maritimum TaxID=500162 RepID=A0ABP3T8H4_9GAMM